MNDAIPRYQFKLYHCTACGWRTKAERVFFATSNTCPSCGFHPTRFIHFNGYEIRAVNKLLHHDGDPVTESELENAP